MALGTFKIPNAIAAGTGDCDAARSTTDTTNGTVA